jgi:glycosyltransferase involved in cell wall biosynthesis
VHTAELAQRIAARHETRIAAHAAIDDRQGLERCTFAIQPSPLGVLWQQTRLAALDADVLWAPHGTLPLRWRKPSIATVHDFTSITMPHRHRLKTIVSYNLFIGRSLEQATRVACVSRAVADETMRGFGVAAERIEVVPNGVDSFFSPGGGEGDFILFTGTLEPRKGIDDLLAVWRSLPEPRPRLVLCGDAGWRTGIPNDPAIEVTGYVRRERLRELYRGARAFVYPSHYEGFGIPPLEAMACGAPVIATRTGAIPEYGEGAAELVAPGDTAALRESLLRVLRDDSLRRELRAAGPERARDWSWERGAKVMLQMLEAVG